jgi:hypothetical protein
MGFSLIKYTKGTRAEQSHDRIRTVGEGEDLSEDTRREGTPAAAALARTPRRTLGRMEQSCWSEDAQWLYHQVHDTTGS